MSSAQEYTARAADHCRMKGYAKGDVPVISVTGTAPEWLAWIAYFDGIGMGWSVKEMRRLLHQGSGTWTVPERHPSDFDPRFTLSDADCLKYAERDKGPALPEGPWRRAFAACLCRQDFKAAQRIIDAYKSGHPLPGQAAEDGERMAG